MVHFQKIKILMSKSFFNKVFLQFDKYFTKFDEISLFL